MLKIKNIVHCIIKSHSNIVNRQVIWAICEFLDRSNINYRIINLPIKRNVYVLLKSPHVYKKFKHKYVYNKYKSNLLINYKNLQERDILVELAKNSLNCSLLKFIFR